MKRNSRPDVMSTEITATYVDDGKDEVLDAVITAAALVARADGWIDAVERIQLFDFLDRNELLSYSTRADVRHAFELRIRELRRPDGPVAALGRLRRHAGRSLARFIIDVGEEIAAADCRLDRRERHILRLIKIILWAPPSLVDQTATGWKWRE
jgi:tellurite resistance protein